RHRNADRFGTEPIEPAEREFPLLFARETARPRQQMAPMFAQNLEAAIGPAMALLLVGVERVGQQAVAVAPVGIVDVPAELERGEAEISVLHNRVARPAAGGLDRGAPDEAHGTVH